MSNPDQVCFLPEPGDTNSFASSVAVNDKYLVVGDSGANRVVVFQKNTQGQWYRDREIYPPENSIPYERSNGFGINLMLGENALIVNNWSTMGVTNNTNHSIPCSIFRGQYLIQLDREQSVIPIELSISEKEGFIEFYVLLEDQLWLITLPNNNKDLFSYHIKHFSNFAVSNNLLLVGWLPDTSMPILYFSWELIFVCTVNQCFKAIALSKNSFLVQKVKSIQ